MLIIYGFPHYKNNVYAMWIYVILDFSSTGKGRKAKKLFSLELEKDGFTKVNTNLYARYCQSTTNAKMLKERIKLKLLENSRISIIFALDNQNENSYHFYGRKRYKNCPQEFKSLPLLEFF